MAALALVPDASVVVKWIADEEDADQARLILRRFREGAVELVAPDLLYAEVANALRHSRKVKAAEAEEFLATLLALGIENPPLTAAWCIQAVREARAARATVYDALYLALAKRRNAVMVTADAEFDRKARSKHVTTLAKAYEELKA